MLWSFAEDIDGDESDDEDKSEKIEPLPSDLHKMNNSSTQGGDSSQNEISAG